MTTTAPPTDADVASSPASALPVLIALSDMVKMFPVKRQTIYTWRLARSKSGPKLPPHNRVLAGKPFWHEDVVLTFAAKHGYELDLTWLAKLRDEQNL